MGPVPRPASEGGTPLIRPLTFEERMYLSSVGEAADNASGYRQDDDLLHRFLSGKASRAESCAVVRILLRLGSQSLAQKAAQ